MEYPSIRLAEGRLTPFGPSVELDIASALHANPRAGEALGLAASAILYFRQHRAELLAFAEIVTDLADMVDGDPDFEDATDAEDDHALSPDAALFSDGPGCVVSDPADHDGTQADTSWSEWHTRGRHKDNPGIFDSQGRQLHEDAEEDDAPEEDDHPGQCTEDEISCGPGNWGPCNWLTDQGPGCQISDAGIADNGGLYD